MSARRPVHRRRLLFRRLYFSWGFGAIVSSVAALGTTTLTLGTTTLGTATLGIGLVGLAGCGSSGPFDYVKVKGKVVYDDGSPIPLNGQTRVVFTSQAAPVDEKYHPRPAVGYLESDGTLSSVTSHKYGDGLVPGKHKVFFSAFDTAGKALIPPEYGDASTTPLEIDTADAPLEIKIRKPTQEELNSKDAPPPKY